MSPSARFEEADFLLEIDDHLPYPHTLTAIAGYAVLASHTRRALVFGIGADSGLDPVSLSLQPNRTNRPPSLFAWMETQHDGAAPTIGVAALTTDGVLRVFPYVVVRGAERPQCLTNSRCYRIERGSRV